MSQQINLYNPALAPTRALVTPKGLALAVAAVLVLVLAVGAVAESRRSAGRAESAAATAELKNLQDRVQSLARQVAGARATPALQAQLDALDNSVASRGAIIAVADGGLAAPGKGYADILRGLARLTTTGLWLTGVDVTVGGDLELRGRAVERTAVAAYLGRLNAEPAFAGRSFSGLRIAPPPEADKAAAKDKEAGAPVQAAYLEFFLAGANRDADKEKTKAAVPADKGKSS